MKKVHNLPLICKNGEDGRPDESKALNVNFNPPRKKRPELRKKGLENTRLIFFTKVNSMLLVGRREACQRCIPGNWETPPAGNPEAAGGKTLAKCERNQLVGFLSEYLTFCSCN